MEPLDLEPGFEPQIRARSNTWPLPRPENYIDKDDNTSNNLINVDPTKLELLQNSAVVSASNVPTSTIPVLGQLVSPATAAATGQIPKKNSSRRNAWGNMSYADLITQAIQSAPDKRLTLSQIYEWMVQNVPYFKDKGDSNSSAGWKGKMGRALVAGQVDCSARALSRGLASERLSREFNIGDSDANSSACFQSSSSPPPSNMIRHANGLHSRWQLLLDGLHRLNRSLRVGGSRVDGATPGPGELASDATSAVRLLARPPSHPIYHALPCPACLLPCLPCYIYA
ncbi:hypothetical protein B566_EDAN007312 [Ephemera danica]|nr:hypothetical protein B566_EDAN007312 [Ephemera danica]